MTQDEIIDMAYKAGLEVHKWKKTKEYQIRCWYEEFYDFAQLVAEHERNECAKLADISVDFWVKGGFPECAEVREAMHIGEAIRARKQA
jgi:hypothetical protein